VASRFGAYEILYELKTGGMGAVLLGRRRGPGAFEQLVAIKTILASHAQSPAVRAMFLDEAALLARLNHPAIATVHDFGEQRGTLYMVMEYVAGIAFRDVMQHGLPATVAAGAIAEACRGVHAAHELRDLSGHLLGVVHRDISPDNLMFGFDGHIKVIDFGIALVKNRQAPVTELGMLKGKPPYMSPEQVKNEAIDRRSDVFSLAVVLWEMLTGQALFGGDSLYAVALAVEQQDILPPSQVLGARLPPGLDAVVLRALDRDLARRTPSAAAFAEELEQVIQAVGDESLEAWAERVLAAPRTAHRAWLASVVAGQDAPRAIGRPTGAVTALAPIEPTPVAAAVAPPEAGASPSEAPEAGASPPEPPEPPGPPRSDEPFALGGMSGRPAAPRRRLAIALAVLGVALVGGAIALISGVLDPVAPRDQVAVALDPVPPRDPVAADAAVDAAVDAAREAAAVHDAGAPPADAPIHAMHEPTLAPTLAPVDAGRRPVRPPRDAGRGAARTIALDAAAPVVAALDAAQGWAALTAKHKGSQYLNVVLDGRIIGPTPMFKQRISTGSHVIELVEPRTGDVVVRRTVTADVGENVTIVPP
jgi:eukaryotic-like serine/threonine-protein kinase